MSSFTTTFKRLAIARVAIKKYSNIFMKIKGDKTMTSQNNTRGIIRSHMFSNQRKNRYFKMHLNEHRMKMAARIHRKRKPSSLVTISDRLGLA